MPERLTDDQLRAAAARRPGYATYPEYAPGGRERLGRLPAVAPALTRPVRAPGCPGGPWCRCKSTAPCGQRPARPGLLAPDAPRPEEELPEPIAAVAAGVQPLALDARPPAPGAAPVDTSLAALPPSRVYDFPPLLIKERPWWRPRWQWAVLTKGARARWGYAWTEAGARRRTARAVRRAGR